MAALSPVPSRSMMRIGLNALGMSTVPGHGKHPHDWQYVQDDSGADMSMLNDKAWAVLGYTSEVDLWAGTAKEGEAAVKLDAVAPLIVAMEGVMGIQGLDREIGAPDSIQDRIITIRFMGATAIAFNGGWANLLSRNGVEHGGFDTAGKEMRLDNEVYAARGYIVFDQSKGDDCVTVPLRRWKRSSYVKMRPPTPSELAVFMARNPHLAKWTADELIQGTLRYKKVSLRGQAHDALPHIGDGTLDRLIRHNAIEGMAAVVPMSGVDPIADEEIEDCEGCKARMHAPARRNSRKPRPVQPGDLAIDIQQFPCKQVGTAAMYGTIAVLLYYKYMMYETHGTEKSGFDFTLEKIRVRTKRLQNVDMRGGRIFCSFATDGEEMTELEIGDEAVFNYLFSDSDSVIKAFHTRMKAMAMDVDQTFSAAHVHNRNPTENYMRVAKESALAMQAMAGLPDSLVERCYTHAAEMCGLTLPKKVYHPAFRNITPVQAFTGQRPRWKDIQGFVMGMQCWYLREKETRPQMGIAARHDGWGFWVGRDVESWSHMIYDPYTSQLVAVAVVSGSPNTMYKDVMGAQNHLRLEIMRAARGCTEHDHRNIMATIERSQMLRKEQSGAYRDAMRYGGHGSEAAEKALLIGRMLDESAMAMLTKFEEIVKKDRVQRQLEGGVVDHSDGGAAVQIEGGAAAQIEGGDSRFGLSVKGAPVAPILEKRRSSREMKRPADTTSWQSKTWEQTVQKMQSMKVGAGEEINAIRGIER